MLRLKDKTILISAAGQGIGRASVEACVKEGARVIAVDVNRDTLATLEGAVDGVEVHQLDVRDRSAIEALVKKLPPLDGLFNCAGFVHNGTILEISEEDWAFSFELNVTSMYRMIQIFLPGLLSQAESQGSAAVLNMASVASSLKGLPNRTAYGATKAAVIGLTKAVAADYVSAGLRCNALCPGTVDTPSLRDRIAGASDPIAAEKAFIARQPMGRLATVGDITPFVIALLSDESRFITGQAVSVDGGLTI